MKGEMTEISYARVLAQIVDKPYKEFSINERIMIKDTFFVWDKEETKNQVLDKFNWLRRTTFRVGFVERLRNC